MLALISFLATSSPPQTPCTSGLDCSLNGECDTATALCICDRGWKGEVCGTFDFDETQTSKALRGLHLDNTSTWGGTPIVITGVGGRKSFHLFAEYMVEDCSLTHWVNNSQIVHAVAASPLGPFRIQSVAFQPFRHSVGVARMANGTLVMFQTGCDVWPDRLVNCTANRTFPQQSRSAPLRPSLPPGCTGLIPPPPATRSIYWPRYSLSGRVRVGFSTSPDGPWTSVPYPVLQPQQGNGTFPSSWDAFTTNAAPMVLPNGSIVLAYRGSFTEADAGIGLAIADNIAGPYRRLNGGHPIFSDHAEDPFIYQGKRGSFHIVVHKMPPSPKRPSSFPFNTSAWQCGDNENACIGHAFAESLHGPWYFSPNPAAQPKVSFYYLPLHFVRILLTS